MLNDIIVIFIVTYHRLLEIKLFVVAGSFTDCVFVPQVFLRHELRCEMRRDWRKRKKRTDLPFALKVAQPAQLPVAGETPATFNTDHAPA